MRWREPWLGLAKGESPAALLELGLAAGADVLVTGDSDLLALVSDFPVPIFNPKALKEHQDLSRPPI